MFGVSGIASVYRPISVFSLQLGRSAMGGSVRVTSSSVFIRMPPLATAAARTHSVQFVSRFGNGGVRRRFSSGLACLHASFSSPVSPNPVPLTPVNSIASSPPFDSRVHLDPLFQSQPREVGLGWNTAVENAGGGGEDVAEGFGRKDLSIMVVLLGWLGAKPKHLRRFVEWYNSRGINAVTCVVAVTELLSFDLGMGLEKRIAALGSDLDKWASEKEDDGRERCLVFHTFSNTGWLTYGLILDSFSDGARKKIRGVIVDSGGGDAFNPKIWAAGFTTAILAKRKTSVNRLVDRDIVTKLQKEEPTIVEAMLSYVLEMLFVFLVKLPDSDRRLRRVVNALTEHEPSCPQLYLYSSADRIIPFELVEMLVEEQRRKGIEVFSFNFGSSPHVDHYRHFPDTYSSQLINFLRECFVITKQKT